MVSISMFIASSMADYIRLSTGYTYRSTIVIYTNHIRLVIDHYRYLITLYLVYLLYIGLLVYCCLSLLSTSHCYTRMIHYITSNTK